ncbi:dTDP-glucose 4,6-dehydratase [Alicyclobacillus dauci]|uniref:dTDP-glucose 4,6-dehydratase n=1 Tax=Alicyclobacillus dauci TaxID=1475485 RepID=A0ABY6Z9G3_9BACL|nr:dTDP-glucose 4,6-dehydratase [Alicyclobacillus dauci]WAH38901.1 dTDP-glucose 4,6-dehydratase [Alicyclobacillus dauci]
MRRILVTGGAGFIGSNFCRYLMRTYTDIEVVNLDALTYAGNPSNLDGMTGPYQFIHGNICDAGTVRRALMGVHAVVHFAAESHVDRSIQSTAEFVHTNVEGTRVLLESACAVGIDKFVHVSTDEVYGSLGEQGVFRETSPIEPNSPYSASKAASDLLARAYFKTYGLPVCITRSSNNYGPYQHPEKLIPKLITYAIEGRKLPIYGDGTNVRDWMHVLDHCRAIDCVLQRGTPGEIYNVGASNEQSNVDIAKQILACLGLDESLIEYVPDRPGHDWRYAIDASKIMQELGWRPRVDFHRGLAETVEWYVQHGLVG